VNGDRRSFAQVLKTKLSPITMMPLVQVVDVVGRVLDLEEVVGEGGGGEPAIPGLKL
jgi:hypothetical protein